MPTIITQMSTRGGNGNVSATGPHSYIDTTRSAVRKTSQHAQRRSRPHVFMPPTPFTATENITVRANVYYKTAFDAVTGWTFIDYGASIPSMNNALLDSIQNRCLIDCLNDLKGQNVNYAQAFAERQQTVNLVSGTAKRLANTILDLKKGNFVGAAARLGLSRKPKKAFRTVGQQWLELQYGWKPLLSDIYGACEDLAVKDNFQPDRYRVTVKKTRREIQEGYTNVNSGIHFEGPYRAQHSVFIRLDYRMENPFAVSAARSGISNPLTLAWELLPWSFVADWFIPVGSYLSTMDATNGWQFLGGSATRRWHVLTHGVVKRTGYNFPGRVVPYWGGYGASNSSKNINRVVYSSSPTPRFPGFKNPLSLTHMANAIALLSGSVR